MNFFARLVSLVVCVFALACPAPSTPDGGVTPADDGGALVMDAGAPVDGGPHDAGSTPDASVVADGGNVVDAGALDGGADDAGFDAGVPVAPDTRVTQRPAGALSGTAMVTFGFECDVGPCTFACSWDQEPFASCTSPATRAGFTDGRHRFEVRASRAGLTDLTAASEPFIIDALPPSVAFSTTPLSGAPNSRPSVFGAPTCDEAPCTFECRLDQGAFSACPTPLSFDALSVGQHTVAVRGTDAVGNTSAAVTHTFSVVFGWRSVDLTDSTACGVTGDRRLACWGSNNGGQLGLGLMNGGEGGTQSRTRPTFVGVDTNWNSVTAGSSFFCGTKTNGAVLCWGRNQAGLFADPAVAPTEHSTPTAVAHGFSRFSVGDATGCGVDATGALWCWGSGDDGALGDGDLSPHVVSSPLRVGTATWRVVSVRSHACGVQTDGSLWCFGRNSDGETGVDPMTPAIAVPTRVGADLDWVDVSVGENFSCALKQSGQLFCFGTNNLGELASLGPSTHTPTRVGTTTFSTLRAYGNGVCAVSMSEAFCWGDGADGALGSVIDVEFAPAPTRVDTTTPLVRALGRYRLRCALTATDGLECWGDNARSLGGLGRGVAAVEATPVLLDGSYASVSVTSSSFGGPASGGCGIKLTGQLVCWGAGGHVGRSNVPAATTPTPVTADTDWTSVKLSMTSTPLSTTSGIVPGHACGLRNGLLFCWGRNGAGQLGNGGGAGSLTPVAVPPFGSGTTWVQVAVSDTHTCGITSAGRLSCWGSNQQGQLGDGTNVTRLAPTGLNGTANTFTDWTQVSASRRTVARQGNGTLWQWGQGATSTPAQVDTATDWAEGLAFPSAWCGRKSDGTVHCRATPQTASTQVGTFTDATALIGASNQSCALRASGVVTCFRFNGSAWVVEADLPGPWKTLSRSASLGCGVGLDDQRRCFGVRGYASFGDGVDERVPAPVLTP